MSQEASGTGEEKESVARADLPYRAEYCKTSRAKCKKCSEPMPANSLKLANMTKSRFHDGMDAVFYHVNCFFQIKRPNSVAEIRHFETLKYDDQKMLEKAVESQGLSVLGKISEPEKPTSGKQAKKTGKKREAAAKSDGALVNYDDFLVEYAKSSRSTCITCQEKIDKGCVRLGKLDFDAETTWTNGPVPRWYHVDCFVKSQEKLKFFGQVEKIKSFNELEKDDQKMLRNKVKFIQPSEDVKKPKIESKADKEEEALLKKQSDRFFALREKVNSMKRKDIETMMEHMRQKSFFKSSAVLIDMATDILLFGPLERCPVCKKRGNIELRGGSYICTRMVESETRCTYETRDPPRSVPDVPDELAEKYSFFEDYEFLGGKRIFPSTFVKAVEQKEAEDNKTVVAEAPLNGLSIGVITWLGSGMDRSKLEKKVTTLGGKLRTALDSSLFIILTNSDELAKDSAKVEVAKALEVPFATSDFLLEIKSKEDVVPKLKKCLIGDSKAVDIGKRFNKMYVEPDAKNVKTEEN